ncbi:uncharacterized protein FA14DRAFT_182175 [Meira miltonrushii]|uniref:Uncharacterized protein n=1 Tax=Meira miltonrushii TaxID=1280837 RepID=A0A316V3Z7_9BASI|nr:uncharacterized protein FA14DRAFT_182175 [Meira miltonrushii]PWN32266.1 hypothetical protein FA14DRAFT_182175 [Meira miltonrushii]
MKRSRSESTTARSSSTNDSYDSSSETDSQYDTSVSKARSPSPSVPKKPVVKETNRVASSASKHSKTATPSSTPSKRSKPKNSETKMNNTKSSSDKVAQNKSPSTTNRAKSGNPSHISTTKGSTSASHFNGVFQKRSNSGNSSRKKHVVEVIDISDSEYSPSDSEDGTGSSSSSESEIESHQTKEPAHKKAKIENIDEPKAEQAIRKNKSGMTNHHKHASRPQKAEGKEATRFSREEDAAIIAYIEESIRTVDLMKHLRKVFPDQAPRNKSSVRYRRLSILKRCKDIILGTDSVKE